MCFAIILNLKQREEVRLTYKDNHQWLAFITRFRTPTELHSNYPQITLFLPIAMICEMHYDNYSKNMQCEMTALQLHIPLIIICKKGLQSGIQCSISITL